MTPLDHIQHAFREGRVSWRSHAAARMLERGISRQEVFDLVAHGEILEVYEPGTFHPSCLMLGAASGRALHAVIAWNADAGLVYVITVYEPDDEHFEPDRRTRKVKEDE